MSSSRNTISGRPTRARATKSRWRSPPDSAPKGPPQQRSELPLVDQLGRRARRRVQGGEEPQRLADPHPLGQGGVLQLGADAAAQPVTGRGRVEAEDTHRAAVGRGADPWRISTVVVLPAPFVPSRPNSSPRWTENETSLTTSASP